MSDQLDRPNILSMSQCTSHQLRWINLHQPEFKVDLYLNTECLLNLLQCGYNINVSQNTTSSNHFDSFLILLAVDTILISVKSYCTSRRNAVLILFHIKCQKCGTIQAACCQDAVMRAVLYINVVHSQPKRYKLHAMRFFSQYWHLHLNMILQDCYKDTFYPLKSENNIPPSFWNRSIKPHPDSWVESQVPCEIRSTCESLISVFLNVIIALTIAFFKCLSKGKCSPGIIHYECIYTRIYALWHHLSLLNHTGALVLGDCSGIQWWKDRK